MKRFIALSLAILLTCGGLAYADGQLKGSIDRQPTLAAGSIASGDLIPVYDVSADAFRKVDATAFSLLGGGTFTGDIVLANGKALQTTTTTAQTALLAAYDVDGTAYKTFGTLTSGNTPSFAITAPSGGTVTVDGATIGGTTAAAGTFTALQANTTFKVNATDGTSITAIRFAFDAVASGQTSKTTTLTGVTASSRCVATPAENSTSAVYLRSAVPGTNQVVITTSADPGASNLDYTVMCFN